MRNRSSVKGKAALKAAKSSLFFTMLLTLCVFWVVSPALAQEDPFGSQYSPPPTAPPSDPCGDASGSNNANCEDPPEASGDTGDNATGEADEGSTVLSESDGPVVDLLPTTGGVPVAAAALLGGSALLGAGVLAVRRR